METRKVQSVGESTLSISLPKRWAEAHDVRKGSQVFLIEEGDALKVVSARTAEQSAAPGIVEYVINADLCKDRGMLERIIVGNYVLGREKMIVRSEGRLRSEHLKELRNVTGRLIGLGIVEETAGSITLQCSLDPAKYPLEGLLKRLFNIGTVMLEESMEALLTSDRKLAEDVVRREDDADMMYWLCVRLILSAQVDESLMKKIGVKRRFELAGNRLVAKDLESVADYCKEIACNVIMLVDNGLKLPEKLSSPLKNYGADVRELYGKTLTALLSKDLEMANGVIERREELEKKEMRIQKMMTEGIKDPTVLLSVRSIMHNLEKMAEFSISMSAIAINRYLESPTKFCMPGKAVE